MSKSLKEMADEVTAWCITKGWEPDPGRTFGDECALIHSEVSEALEAYRDWKFVDATGTETGSKPEGVGSEFADILIRLLHYTNTHGFDLEAEFERKMAFNQNRPWRHGGRNLLMDLQNFNCAQCGTDVLLDMDQFPPGISNFAVLCTECLERGLEEGRQVRAPD